MWSGADGMHMCVHCCCCCVMIELLAILLQDSVLEEGNADDEDLNG